MDLGLLHKTIEMSPSSRTPVAIVGARGYSGLELARLALGHSHLTLAACFGRDPGWRLSHDLIDPRAQDVPVLPMDDLRAKASSFDTVFFATPPEVSLEFIPQIASSTQVIDLSGAFRLGPNTDAAGTHVPAFYGLSPFSSSQALSHLKRGSVISNPGCFATSVLMALIPLLKAGLVDSDHLVIDSKSGASGAGRKASEPLLFTEISGDCLPYRVGRHQHLAEMIKYLKEYTEVTTDPHFVTHLLPVERGIISGIYATLTPRLASHTDNDIHAAMGQAYEQAYGSYPLVRHGPLGVGEAQDRLLLSLKKVVGTAMTHISYTVTGKKLYVFSCIDNLLKGAASQAIENWNRSHELPVTTGLIS